MARPERQRVAGSRLLTMRDHLDRQRRPRAFRASAGASFRAAVRSGQVGPRSAPSGDVACGHVLSACSCKTGEGPVVRYADADGVSIAYSVIGDGAIDVVRVPGVMTGINASGVDPIIAAHYDHLSRFARLILLDRRGLGMSDPLVAGGAPPLEQQVQDILAVMDAVGSHRAALYGGADGGLVALMFAAMHPDRTSALVLNSSWARVSRSADHPFGIDPVGRDERRALTRSQWGNVDNPWAYEYAAPSRLDDPGFRRLLARVQQVSASQAAAS